MREHDYLQQRSHAYRKAFSESRKASRAAQDYRKKWLELREAVREYFRGNVSEDELKSLSGWK